MEFENSTQRKCWMFDEASLRECKRAASLVRSNSDSIKARNFACGFHRNQVGKRDLYERADDSQSFPLHSIATGDQDTLVHFHAHQIQRLVGPNAVFPALKRSASSLSTAIMLFRRFYLSNSVIEFHPRDIAAASALLAIKVDCERKLPIEKLSRATSFVHSKAHKATLCRAELKAVSVPELECAEKALLQGLDFNLHCHHPYGAIHVLAREISLWCLQHQQVQASFGAHMQRGFSKRSIPDEYRDDALMSLCQRSLAVAQSALVYSDVNFLFEPRQIAFAAVAIALEGKCARRSVLVKEYLRSRFPNKTKGELDEFMGSVKKIIHLIDISPEIELSKFLHCRQRQRKHSIQSRVMEVQRVFVLVAGARYSRAVAPQSNAIQAKQCTKRLRSVAEHGYYDRNYVARKVARVTPISSEY